MDYLESNLARSLFKKCFKNPIFSLVPFEIWRDLIVSNADSKTVTFLSQTCHAFKEVVDCIGKNNLNLALKFRKEEQIALARKYLVKCAENNNSNAMFHIGFSMFNLGGFGFVHEGWKSGAWFQKAAECGNGAAMAFYSWFLKTGYGYEKKNEEMSFIWAKKCFSSNNLFGIAMCYQRGLARSVDFVKAFNCFETVAKDGDEFGQYFLAQCFEGACGTSLDHQNAFYWYCKSAQQGLACSQHLVGKLLRRGRGCEKNEEAAILWLKKAQKQGNAWAMSE